MCRDRSISIRTRGVNIRRYITMAFDDMIKEKKMNNFEKHARAEFEAMGWEVGYDCECNDNELCDCDCDIQGLMCEQVIELLNVFAEHGHSGTSAPYAINLFKKLASFEPIGPLTGKDSEWMEVCEGTWQNKRCSHVFKGADGRAYDIDGKVFRDENGSCYTNKESRVYVEFPYTPTTEYVDIKE